MRSNTGGKAARGGSDLPPDLAALKRAADAAGVPVRFPKPGVPWDPPEPLPIDANEMSRFVVRLRRLGRL